jgi:hypothetical protein
MVQACAKEKNLLAEQRGNDVVHSCYLRSWAGLRCRSWLHRARERRVQKQNHLDLRVQLGINSWFPKSGFGVRTVLIEIDLSGRGFRRFGGTVFPKYDFQGFQLWSHAYVWLLRLSGQEQD